MLSIPLFTILLLVAVAFWLVKRRRTGPGAVRDSDDGPSGFTIVLRAGSVVKTTGVVPRTVYNAFEEVAMLTEAEGEIRWDPEEGLRFSSDFPDGVKQQFRNVFGVARVH